MSANQDFEEVREASRNWVLAFNQGNIEGCLAGYRSDATMEARPMGTYVGIKAIEDFWRPFVESGAGELTYSNIHLRQAAPSTVILSADWCMNVGKGIITCERWVKDEAQGWQLQEDRFEILEQYSG